MTLHLIEKAILPQFTWKPHPGKRLQTYGETGKDQSFGIIVFIGIAESYGFSQTDIADFCAIEDAECEAKAKVFSEQWEAIQSRKIEGTLQSHKDFTDRLYLKVQLTINAIRSNYRGRTIHCKLVE